MLPPNQLYSAEFHNNATNMVSVTVTYDDGQGEETQNKMVDTNGTVLFDRVRVNHGSWESVKPIKSISCHTYPLQGVNNFSPSVQGVHQKKVFNIDEYDGGLHLNEVSKE